MGFLRSDSRAVYSMLTISSYVDPGISLAHWASDLMTVDNSSQPATLCITYDIVLYDLCNAVTIDVVYQNQSLDNETAAVITKRFLDISPGGSTMHLNGRLQVRLHAELYQVILQ